MLGHCRRWKYARDDDGSYARLVQEQGEDVAAVLWLPGGTLMVSGLSTSAEALVVEDLQRRGAWPNRVFGPGPDGARWTQHLAAHHAKPAGVIRRHRVFVADAVRAPDGPPGTLRRTAAGDVPVVTAWSRAFAAEAMGGGEDAFVRFMAARLEEGDVHLWCDAQDRPACLVGVAAHSEHGARVGPVYTPPGQRGQGHAARATAALTQRLLDGGKRFACLFTDLANPVSNRLYPRIGYRPVDDVVEVGVLPGSA